MPNRIIRAEILGSDRVDALSAEAEVFYRRLMSLADDYGRYDGDWRILRSELYPLRAERIAKSEIEAWLEECARVLDGEEEALVTVYHVRRKRYVQINNFGQRIRGESKYPAPALGEKRERENPLPSADNGAQSRTSAARASDTNTNTPLSPHTPPNTNTNTHSNTNTPERANCGEPPEGHTRSREGSDGVQAKVLNALRTAGFTCQAEFRMPNLEFENGATAGLRADVAVLVSDKPAFLIECKDYAHPENGALRWELTAQCRKYAESGIPFCLCNGLEEIERTVQRVRETLGVSSAPPEYGFDYREHFERLVAAYPAAGRERLKQASALFTGALIAEAERRQVTQEQVFAEMVEGVARWQTSERWQAGKVHLLRTFLAEELWREQPAVAPVARTNGPPARAAPASRREQATAEFRRRLMRDLEEAQNG